MGKNLMSSGDTDSEQSLSLLRATLESTADGILVVDSEGAIETYNQRFAEMWRIPAGVLSSGSDREALAFVLDQLKTPAEFLAKVTELYSEPDAESFDSLEFKDGRIIERYSRPQYVGGSSVGRVWSFRDVTARKRTEEALRASEAQLSLVTDNVAACIAYFDAGLCCRFANRRFVDFFGIGPDIVGRHLQEIVGDEIYRNIKGHFARSLGGHEVTYQRPHRLADGDYRHVEVKLVPRLGDGGKVLGCYDLMSDITERKRADDARARLAAIVENSYDAIVSRDHDGKILTWNAAAERLFGYTAAEAIGRPISSLIIPAEREAQVAQKRALLERGVRTSSYDSVRLTKDGRRIEVSIRPSPIYDADGKLTGVSLAFRDISERKRAAEAQARLAAIVEHANDAIISRTLDGIVLSWNNAAERLFGYTAAEAIGKDLRQLVVSPEQGQEIVANRQLLSQGKSIPSYETTRLTKDGRRIDISLSISPFKDDRGDIIGVAVVARDITERKRSEIAKAQLAAIVENASDAIFSRTLDGTILSWNAAAERMFGYSASEAIGQSATMMLPPRDSARLVQNTEKLVRGEQVAPRETQRIAKDGRILDILTSLSPIKNSAGEVVGASVILRDISALKEAAAAVKESEERFRAAFDQAAVGMALRGIEPRNTRWMRVNQKLCDILGYPRDELLQLTTLDLTPPAERDIAIDYSERLMRGEMTSYSREKRYVRKDGRIIWVNITLSAIYGPDGRPSHAISVTQDISERKAAEQQLRDYTQRLRMLSRRLFEVEEYARRGLARELHDSLGQNVTALTLNLNMIRGDLPKAGLRKVATRLDDCESLLSASGQLIRDVMADLRPPGLDELGLLAALNHHARQVAGRGAFAVMVKGETLAVRLPPETETTMFRIAQEALINVAKHAHANEVIITLEANPESVVLSVADNGCGYQVPMKSEHASTSLGMVNMRERAESVGAQLRVESTPGRGTRVIVEVAPHASPPVNTRASRSEPGAGTGMNRGWWYAGDLRRRSRKSDQQSLSLMTMPWCGSGWRTCWARNPIFASSAPPPTGAIR